MNYLDVLLSFLEIIICQCIILKLMHGWSSHTTTIKHIKETIKRGIDIGRKGDNEHKKKVSLNKDV